VEQEVNARDALGVVVRAIHQYGTVAQTEAAIAVLSNLVERAGEPVAWMPIETAPKDGTYILVTNEEAGGAWVAKWEPVYASGYMPRNPWSSMMLNTWHLPNRHASSTPTRWQPLPPSAPGASHD
jgi:hypothetical protein